MELTDQEKDLAQALSGTAKSALALIPVLGQALAGYDAYKKSKFERQLLKLINYLNDKVENPSELLKDEWLKSEEGEQFCYKVFDAAMDAQLEDKQELFVNALINGIMNKNDKDLEKLKFTDMLRQMSRSALLILAEMHKIYSEQVELESEDRKPSVSGSPLINVDGIVDKLSHIYHPYLIESSIDEMKSIGLFSPNAIYRKNSYGKYLCTRSHSEGTYVYTEFSCRFVKFISKPIRPKA